MSSNYENSCGWALEHVDPFIDGELTGGDLERFERHLARCETCAAELALARRVLGDLRALPELEPPAYVVEAAARAAGPNPKPRLHQRMAAFLRPTMPRPALAALLVIVAATAFVLWPRAVDEPAPGAPEYTAAEIEAAAGDAIMALGYVGRYGRMPGEIIRDDVIEGRIIPAMHRAMTGETLKQNGNSSDLESSERSSS